MTKPVQFVQTDGTRVTPTTVIVPNGAITAPDTVDFTDGGAGGFVEYAAAASAAENVVQIPDASSRLKDSIFSQDAGAALGTITGNAYVTKNLTAAQNLIAGYGSTVTAAGTTTLTLVSAGTQVFTGVTTQTVVLPVVTTLPQAGLTYRIVNLSTDTVSVQSSGANPVQVIAAGGTAFITNNKITADTTAAAWTVSYLPKAIPFNPAGVGSTASLSFAEITGNGTDAVVLAAPDALGASVVVVLPGSAGTLALTASPNLTTPTITTSMTMADAANIIANTSTGTKIGTATGQKLAFWNATPIIQPASANQAALSLDVDVTGADTVDKAAINTNFSAIQTLVNQLRSDLVAAGVVKGGA